MQSSSWRRYALPPIAAILIALVSPLAFPLAASAQDDGVVADTSAAAPTSAARIDAISGDVAIQRGDANETLAAVANAPVLAGDYVTTGQDGRAEVGFDGRSAVRLGENVQIRLTSVDPANRQMQLAAGTVELRLFGDTDGQSAIDTPSVSVVPRTAGSFRVSVDANGETTVTVRSGRADIVTPQGTQSVEPGTTLLADGPAANPQIQTEAAIALDGFDTYNGDRDHIYLAATSDSQYVNTNIQGIGDLNANGNWVDDGTNGNVWMPTVAAGWAPYRNGNWVWEDGFGWTWVASEPWGWAPYHYGRWYFSTAYHRWAWYPPAPGRAAPAWSPALVGFVGFNIGAVSVGVGFGNIGWVPLAPNEAFHPWWGPHATAFGSVVGAGVHYRNLSVNFAMTSVTRENFQAGQFGHPYVASAAEMREIHAVPVQGALPIVPSQANLRFTQRAASPSLAVRPALMNRSFAGRPAMAAQRTPFNEQQASVSRATHVAYGSSAGSAPSFSRGAGAAGVPAYARPAEGGGYANPAARGAAGNSNDPWQRFNENRTNGTPGYARPNGTPGYARPAAPSAAYARPAAPSYTSGYNRADTSGYSRADTSGYSRAATPAYARPAAPSYTQQQQYRQSTPAYSRSAAPAYSRPAASTYSSNRPAASSYERQATARPAARATRSSDDRRDH